MKTYFYKDRQYPFRLCKVCGVKYRAPYKSARWASRLCYPHRQQARRWYSNQPHVKARRKEYQSRPEVKARAYANYKKWVANNLEYRRLIARRSANKRYHETHVPKPRPKRIPGRLAKTRVPRDLALVRYLL
jgi:hypothetical protein